MDVAVEEGNLGLWCCFPRWRHGWLCSNLGPHIQNHAETSKQNLADQIAQLNSTIDTIQQSLNTTTLEKEEIPA